MEPTKKNITNSSYIWRTKNATENDDIIPGKVLFKDKSKEFYIKDADREGVIFIHSEMTDSLRAFLVDPTFSTGMPKEVNLDNIDNVYQMVINEEFSKSNKFSQFTPKISEIRNQPKTLLLMTYCSSSQFISYLYEALPSDNTEIKEEGLNSEYYLYWKRLLGVALAERASDIHLEARAHTKKAIFRLRINGELVNYETPVTYDFALAMLSILYNVVGKQTQVSMDVTKFQTAILEEEHPDFPNLSIKIRYQAVAAYPPPSFDMVCRLLVNPKSEANEKVLAFEDLGYEDYQSEQIMEMISKPEGVIIIAGTTGSGKSTTLKNMIMYINASRYFKTKIYTIEDPPEYIIPGVTQVPVLRNENDVQAAHEQVSPYEEPLKASMRSDPDTLMIGEIRDMATANGMKKGAQSGHQVLSTIHAASALGIPERLEDFGITPQNMSSPTFLNGLIYQKLLPILCPHCKRKIIDEIVKADALPVYLKTMERLRKVVPEENLNEDNIFLRNEKGCKHCKFTGIVKREVVAEIVKPSFEMLYHFGMQDYIAAYKSWRLSSDKDPVSNNMLGKTVLEHAILKITRGTVSPLDVEAIIGRLDDSHNRLMELIKDDENNELMQVKTSNNNNEQSEELW